MELLLFLQEHRTPGWDALFLTATRLGEETVVLAVLLLLYWCLDKRAGLRVGLCYFAGGWMGQLLKLVFLVPRPFLLNEALTPHEAAVGSATGYSFPSGHTSGAVSMAMGLGLSYKKALLWALMALYVALVGLSRLYLGVHTPLDVGVAVLVTVPVCLLVDWMLATLERPGRAKLYAWLGVLAALALMGVGLARVCLSNVPEEQAADSFKTGGAALGFLLSLYLDRRFIRFQVKARFWQQAIKLVVGVALALLLKEGLKSLLGVGLAMQALRYFLLVLFVGAAYPALFMRCLRGGRV